MSGVKINKMYWRNGQLMYAVPRLNGQRHGISKAWEEDGKPLPTYYYLYSEKVTKEEYRRYKLIEGLAGV